MELIETSLFTKQVEASLSDEEYRALQLHLVLHPDVGDVIPGSGGLRKDAMAVAGPRKAWGRSGDLLLEELGRSDLSAVPVSEERTEQLVAGRATDPAETGDGRLTTE